MSEQVIVSFYNLYMSASSKVMPKLLEKLHSLSLKVVVLVENEQAVVQFNKILWTFSTMAFVPHGCRFDCLDIKDEVPIWVTDVCENPNQASVCVVDKSIVLKGDEANDYSRIVYFSDATDSEANRLTQQRLSHHVGLNHVIKMYDQDKTGWILRESFARAS